MHRTHDNMTISYYINNNYCSYIHLFSCIKALYLYSTIFRLRIFDSRSSNKPWSTNLIHSKIFLIDEKILFLGSANFTYSAFNSHYETIIRINDEKAIKMYQKKLKAYITLILKYKVFKDWERKYTSDIPF